MSSTVSSAVSSTKTSPELHLYWRPGCGFCSMLRRDLDKLGVERVEHDIWQDPDAAAVVRQQANGNETVPTVVIGTEGLVNPSAHQVVDLLRRTAPEALPDDIDSRENRPGGRFVGRLLRS